MSFVEIELDNIGVAKTVDALMEVKDALSTVKSIAKIIRRPMKRTTEVAKQYAPSVTGELRESIRVAVRKPKSGDIVCEAGTVVRRALIQDEIDVVDDTGATISSVKVKRIADARWRWHWVEFGSVNNKAYGYLRKAWDENSGGYVEEIRVGLEKELRSALRKAGVNP